jgi:hypothetical protein
MFNDRRIEVGHLCILIGNNIPVFLKECFVSGEFLRGACDANGDFFDDSKFDGNVDFDSGGNVVHVAFFKSIGGIDKVVEPVYMPRHNKVLGFNCIYGGLVRRVEGFL